MTPFLCACFTALQGDAGKAPAVSFEVRAAGIAEHVRSGRWKPALDAADAALADAEELPESRAAELHFARGVILFSSELESPAGSGESGPGLRSAGAAFSSARALAGPTSLRLDATYDLASCSFQEGERARAQLPEVSGAPMGGAGAGAAPAGGAHAGPDPLQVARAAYSKAKAIFLERLRADWRDADTRANLELLQRRLAELDEIEKKREEEKQQQQQKDPQQDPQQGKPEDPKPQDSSGEPKESRETPQEEPKPESEGEEQGKEPPPSEPSADQEDPASQPEGSQSGEEVHLTREEVQQLLDKLGELEEQAAAIEAALREVRRVPVARDW